MKVERKDVKHQCLLNILLIKVAKMESIGSDVRRIINRNNSQTYRSMEALNKMIRQISSNGWILRNFEILRFSQMSRFLVLTLAKKIFLFLCHHDWWENIPRYDQQLNERKGTQRGLKTYYLVLDIFSNILSEWAFFWVNPKLKFDL